MMHAPLILYIVLFVATVFAPLRWSIISFLLLSNIDLGSLSASIGILNTAKAMVLPVYLLWRFRAYAGHERIRSAPIAWILLTFYVAIASSWSLYPAYSIKLVGHMIGSLIICLMLVRATKAGYLNLRTIVPVTCGVIGMAIFHWLFLHDWGGETERFTTFSGAQAFAAFAAALYCAVLPSRLIRLPLRIALCAVLAISVLLNGSRLWIIGVLLSTLLSVFVSQTRLWIKIITFGATVIVAAILTVEFDTVMSLIAREAPVNRIAAAITAAYGGNLKAEGLGTYNLREELFRRTFDDIGNGSTTQLVFGHGTCNGALIAATLSKNPDPNRAMHNEWLRSIYEWGIAGLLLWAFFIASLFIYALKGVRGDRLGYSKPLVIYLPAFALGLSGENIIAGAGNAVSVGLLTLIAFASISHRVMERASSIRSRRLHEHNNLYRRPGALVRAT
jgi:O-antigen ligase/polysaccharide polymerase Wzy-like membrane protein